MTQTKSKNGFSLKAWFSTDGKHTIQVECSEGLDLEAKKRAMAKAINLYRFVEKQLGTKPQMWDKVMNGRQVAKKNPETASKKPEKCGHHQFEVRITKNGKNEGKKYRRCAECGDFLGWAE